MPWCRVVGTEFINLRGSSTKGGKKGTDETSGWDEEPSGVNSHSTLGWRPSCSCPEAANPIPGLVLDPFAGSGRTLIAARRLGLRAVGCELNPEYAAMARRLIEGDNPIFNALPAYEPEHAGLFDSLEPTP